MKKILCASAAALLLAAFSTQAISLSGEAGRDYTHVGAGMGLGIPGLGASAGWTHGDNSNDIYGLGLHYRLPVGPLSLTVGGKALYLNQDKGKDGSAVALGGGLEWPINRLFSVYGEGYYAPEAFSSHVDHYVEGKAGVRWHALPPLTVDVGYRYINLAGQDGRGDNRVADSAYAGVALSF
ncbi:hypothetical protein FJU30_11930 [Affinibrenneria salicis]|uniref:Porin n=1 Tax=Affinibrenneria salicis TaxID=2590031 RepID=A0A5J5G0B0_9GAMM|nr:YfaZ family outer membrane protein [Affinibrenneria salicis]KAA8999991.1 hypothetical protein FJU30_11930 [Affinibrenneria salicis]